MGQSTRDSMQALVNVIRGKFAYDFGQHGADYITDTNAHKQNWVAIKADGAANAVFTTLTTSSGDNLDGVTLIAGDTIYGPFTNITLTSGGVIAYRKS
jgi:hypothetical protein